MKANEKRVENENRKEEGKVQRGRKEVQEAGEKSEMEQKRVEGEQRKIEVGMSVNYNVVLAQRDFTDAQNSELRAILNYRKALVDFQRKQETASSGGSSGTSTGGIVSSGGITGGQ